MEPLEDSRAPEGFVNPSGKFLSPKKGWWSPWKALGPQGPLLPFVQAFNLWLVLSCVNKRLWGWW